MPNDCGRTTRRNRLLSSAVTAWIKEADTPAGVIVVHVRPPSVVRASRLAVSAHPVAGPINCASTTSDPGATCSNSGLATLADGDAAGPRAPAQPTVSIAAAASAKSLPIYILVNGFDCRIDTVSPIF